MNQNTKTREFDQGQSGLDGFCEVLLGSLFFTPKLRKAFKRAI